MIRVKDEIYSDDECKSNRNSSGESSSGTIFFFYFLMFYSDFESDRGDGSDSKTKNAAQEIRIKSYAPGEGGKFVNFDTVKFAEERSFPHLFPRGNTVN